MCFCDLGFLVVFFFSCSDFCSSRKALLNMDRVRTLLWVQLWPCLGRYASLDLMNNNFPPVVSAAAPSWRRWTPSKRCGCRSGSMKKTEHVPSTGRPSKMVPIPAHPQNCPQTSPRHTVGDSCTCHVRVPLHRPLLNKTSCFASSNQRKPTHYRVDFSICTSLFSSPLPPLHPQLLLLYGGSTHQPPNTHTHTYTHRGPSGCLMRGQQLALWTRPAGHATLI